LNSIESEYREQFESLDKATYNEWKKSGVQWEKEIICQHLILDHRLGDSDQVRLVECGINISEPSFKLFEPVFLSQICHEVWTHFQNLPPEQTRDVGRDQVISQFEKVISSSTDIPEATKEVYLKYLKEPFRPGENKFRKVVGLNPLQGEDDDHKV
jgi:hypothetical protein